MDMEDFETRTRTPLPLRSEDLSSFSVYELEERIEELQAEITRCQNLISTKQESRTGAEAFFKK